MRAGGGGEKEQNAGEGGKKSYTSANRSPRRRVRWPPMNQQRAEGKIRECFQAFEGDASRANKTTKYRLRGDREHAPERNLGGRVKEGTCRG